MPRGSSWVDGAASAAAGASIASNEKRKIIDTRIH
jgi:2-succinyl-5-enolpyruvyl-6-hydroxy-3-cyclohexene-1-carboxylate synthase